MIKSPKLFQGKKGFTTIEVLVAAAILIVAVFSFLSGFVSLTKITKETSITSSFDKQISEICGNIKAGIENYQVNFNFKDSSDQDPLPIDSLPMAWDIGVVAPKDECEWCQGTFGYTIQPLEAMRGLYFVQVRFTHKSWGAATRDFTFVVSPK